MKDYFDISEFIIDPDATSVPIHVVQKVDRHHKPVLNPIRHQLDVPVIISKHSAYRTVRWELDRGRSGNSQHCFGENMPADQLMDHWGAADVRSNGKFDQLLELLIASAYTRVCYYPDDQFIHCDFKGSQRMYFEMRDADEEWQFKYNR